MIRATRFAWPLAAATVLALPRAAQAEPPNAKASPVYVLTLSTDDSDDQAEALTQALRSRVRQSAGWSIVETTQSFDTLAIALKCPPKPDGGCLGRIADQLHADHFVWGNLSKAGKGSVKADVHLWTRGKADVEAMESYSDNLKDASDESLRAIAATLFGKLTGAGATGTVIVHAGSGGGDVLVDGSVRGTLEGGVGRVEVTSGTHTISVRVPGSDATPQKTDVVAGGESSVTVRLGAAPPPPGDGPKSNFPARKVLEYGAIVVGGGLLIAGGIETAAWISDSNASNTDRQQVPKSITDVCANQVNAAAQDACHKSKDAQSVSTLAWVFGGAGAALVGVGVVMLLTDHGTSTELPDAATPAAKAKPKLDVVPAIGLNGGGVDLRVTF